MIQRLIDRLTIWNIKRHGWAVVDEEHLADLEDRNRRMERALGLVDRMGTDRCVRVV